MDLKFTPKQQAFRAEVRSWMEQHVPKQRLKSYDTKEGFEEHRAWERVLNSGRFGMVTWPEALGGRGADLIEWLIFEEEYYRAGAPRPGEPEWYLPPRPDLDGIWHSGTEGAFPAAHGGGRRYLGPGLVRAGGPVRIWPRSAPRRSATAITM